MKTEKNATTTPAKGYLEDVFELTRAIPVGRVTTYGEIATHLALGSARMVGWALRQSGAALPAVPAHRVVNRKGELSGRNFFEPPSAMQARLEAEGIIVKNNQVQDFEKRFWSPSELF